MEKLELHKKLIAESLENWNGLKKASIDHFAQTGKASGSFFLALMEYAESYHNEMQVASHPTLPSDEVEFALKLNKYIHDQCIDGTPHDIGWNVMKMFSTRIAEMERELKDTKRLLQQHIDFRAECTALNDPAITEIDDKHFPF